MLKALHLFFFFIARQALLATHRCFYLLNSGGNFTLHKPSLLSRLSQWKTKPAWGHLLHSPRPLWRSPLKPICSRAPSHTAQYCHCFSVFPAWPHPPAFSCLRNSSFWQTDRLFVLSWNSIWGYRPTVRAPAHCSSPGDKQQPREAQAGTRTEHVPVTSTAHLPLRRGPVRGLRPTAASSGRIRVQVMQG